MLSLRLMLHVMFGGLQCEASREIQRLFETDILQDLGIWSPWRRFSHLKPRFRELLVAEIDARRDAPEDRSLDLFDSLIRARDESGQPLTLEEIHDHVSSMLTAGVDPVAIALTWALYWLHKAPEARRDLLRELGPKPDSSRAADLPLLSAACQETLRMFPVVPTPSGRKLTKRVEIMGRAFEAGVTLLPCTYLVHHRADVYPEPERFRPERFLERQFGPNEYFPFGGGNRTCIGATLAPLQIKVALATILTCRNLDLVQDEDVRPVRHGTLLAPSENFKLIISSPQAETATRGAEVA
jgi:cytochrome P450